MSRHDTILEARGVNVQREGAGQPIILLHGWGVDAQSFDAQRKKLAGAFEVISYNQSGHGGMQIGQSPATIGSLAEDLTSVVSQIERDDIVLLGWSMGAMVAWQALRDVDFNQRISALISIDMSPCVFNTDSWDLGMSSGIDQASMRFFANQIQADWPGTVAGFVPRIFAPNSAVLSGAQADLISRAERCEPSVLAELWVSLSEQDFRRDLHEMRLPTLAIHGAKSQLYSVRVGEYLTRQIPNSQLAVFDKSGHSPHIEEPDRFYAVVEEFLSNLKA